MTWSNNYTLRELEWNDLDLVLEWRNKDHIRLNMYHDRVITLQEHLHWFRRIIKNPENVYLVFEKNKTPLGLVCFTDINRENSLSQWGFYLGEEGLPKGTGMILGCLALEYAFEKLELRKVCGEVLGFNIASQRFHEKLGFVKEGCLSRHVLKRGKYEDVIIYALFRDKWWENRIAIEQQLST